MRRTLSVILVSCLLAILLGCNSYGTKLEYNGSELYYTKNVTEAEAKKLGDYLVSIKAFEGDKKSVQLDKSGDTYQVRIPLKKGLDIKDVDENSLAGLSALAAGVSKEVFNGAKVEIHLCDDHFKTLKVVEMHG